MQIDDAKKVPSPSTSTDVNKETSADSIDSTGNETVSFEDLYDLKEIQRLQDRFARATGVACQILRPDGSFITERSNYCRLCGDIIRGSEKGLVKCTESDTSLGQLSAEGLNIYRCRSAGLLEAGAPICIEGRHIATWGLGQVCDGTQTETGIRDFAREIGVDEDVAAKAFSEVTVMSRDRFEDVAQTMHIIANQLADIGYQNLQKARLIKEQERVENDLRESEKKFRRFYENSPFGIMVCEMIRDSRGNDIDFVHLQANPATPGILGMELADLVGRKATEIADEKTAAKFIHLYGKVVRTRKPFNIEQYFSHHDRTLQVTAFPLVAYASS